MEPLFKEKSDLFIGMYIMHPETYEPVQVNEITEYGSVKFRGGGGSLWGRSIIVPVSLTPSKLGCYGFGTFGSGDKVFYHEEVKGDPDHEFYAEYSFEDRTLIINSKTANIERDGVKYLHELQGGLLDAGFIHLAMDTKVPYSGNTKIIIR